MNIDLLPGDPISYRGRQGTFIGYDESGNAVIEIPTPVLTRQSRTGKFTHIQRSVPVQRYALRDLRQVKKVPPEPEQERIYR